MSIRSIKSKLPTATKIISVVASVAATAVAVRKIARDHLPQEFQDYMYLRFCKFAQGFSTNFTMVIYESNSSYDNEIYNAAELYIAAKMSEEIHRVKVVKNRRQKNIVVTMDVKEEFTDVYNGVKFYWSKLVKNTPRKQQDDYHRPEKRYLQLTFHRDHKDMVVNEYLPFIMKDAEMRKLEQKTIKLMTVHTQSSKWAWIAVNLDHPATFETLAMDADMKEMVMKDLDRFVERREHYRKVGKAWKRGYLLYGPPGTGKSSLIAAMANYLHFDIYDLELTDVQSNSDLRRLLMATANRSILVVEDIDCSVKLKNRSAVKSDAKDKGKKKTTKTEKEKKVTLSGFLNFIDGLWSSCGDERIIVFTTNHKDKLDPALIRPGRMDVHIHMSYCTPCGFRLLVSNYLGITQHKLMGEIEDLLLKINVTPAEVAEQLLKHDDPDIVLDGLIKFFDVKRKENEEAEAMAANIKEERELTAIENGESEHSETE